VGASGSGRKWEWAQVGVGASGNGRKWEWAQVGMGASGSGRKWEWAQVGITRKRRYFALSTAAHADLERATVELRHMFLAATDHILQQEESSEVGQPEHACKCTCARTHTQVLKRFQLPEKLWSRLRKSRATRFACPHLRRDWAHPCHICTRSGLTPATSVPGVGSPLPHLHRGWGLTAAHPHLRRDSGPTTR
jgi:hypothetical protein